MNPYDDVFGAYKVCVAVGTIRSTDREKKRRRKTCSHTMASWPVQTLTLTGLTYGFQLPPSQFLSRAE